MHTPDYQQHTKKDLISFTRVMGGFFLLLCGFFFYRNDFSWTSAVKILGGISGLWFIWGAIHPTSTKPLYHGWMWLAFVLNFIMTRVILGILFFLVALPTALGLRIAGKDLLSIHVKKESYWKRRTKPSPHKHFERLYTQLGSDETP